MYPAVYFKHYQCACQAYVFQSCMDQRWDHSDSGIGIGIGIGIGTFSRWAESELNRLLNFQLESELESPLPGIGIGIDRFQL